MAARTSFSFWPTAGLSSFGTSRMPALAIEGAALFNPSPVPHPDQSDVPDGHVRFVMSTPADRPANARAECGYTWMPWGPDAEGVLIYRHMLPAGGFEQFEVTAVVNVIAYDALGISDPVRVTEDWPDHGGGV